MKLIELLEELQQKKEFKNFQEKNPDTFFSAAFLILDIKNKSEQIQLDFFIPTQNKIAAFEFPFTDPKIHDDIISVKNGKTTPTKPTPMTPQTTKIKIDIDDLEPRCKELIKENDSSISPTKIIAILKDDTWNLTLMDNMLGIVRIKLDSISGECKDFSKGGLMDFMGIKKK